MILDSTTKSIQVILAGTVTANQLSCVVSWADLSTAAFTSGANDVLTNDAVAVTLVPAPAASTQRQVKSATIYNDDTQNATVTVRLNNNGSMRTIVKVTLQPGGALQYGENSWTVIGVGGGVSQASTIAAAGSSGQVQYNDTGTALGADANFTWNKSTNILALGGTAPVLRLTGSVNEPSAPPASNLNVFSRTVAGRQFLAQVEPFGSDTSLQPLIARNKTGYWNPPGNAATVPGVFGFTAPTVLGTATARNVATTSLATRMRRLGYVSSATAGSLAGQYLGVAQFTSGSGSDDGSGFFFVCRFVPSSAAAVAGMRMFVGMRGSTAAPTNVEPNTLINVVGVAQLSTDATQLYLCYGGSTAQAAIALGASNFPGQTLSTVAYEIAIFCPATAANTFYVQVTNISSGVIYNTVLTGNAVVVPQSTTLLAYTAYVCNNTTAAAAAIDVCSVYMETDN